MEFLSEDIIVFFINVIGLFLIAGLLKSVLLSCVKLLYTGIIGFIKFQI